MFCRKRNNSPKAATENDNFYDKCTLFQYHLKNFLLNTFQLTLTLNFFAMQ